MNLLNLSDDIANLESTTLSGIEDIDYIKDGNSDPIRWTQVLAQSSGYNIFDVREDLDEIIQETYFIRDNNSYISQSSQDLIVGITNIADITPLVFGSDYSLTINGSEYYFTVTDSNMSWGDLINTYLPLAQRTTDAKLFSETYTVESINSNNDIRITDIENLDDGFTINIQPGTTYLDFITAIGATLDPATTIGTDFDPSIMNNVSLSTRIDGEVLDRKEKFNCFKRSQFNKFRYINWC